MGSGIYVSGELHNKIVVMFGGKILVASGVLDDGNGVSIGFQELVKDHEVGSDPDEDFSEIKPTVMLSFDNEKSIDVVIEHLEKIKKLLHEI